jgi:hypothetical protein
MGFTGLRLGSYLNGAGTMPPDWIGSRDGQALLA